MLISDTKKFVFVHIEKTAGSSITEVLRPHALARPESGWHSILRALGLPRDYRRYRFPTHCGLAEAERKLPEDRYQGYFKFAFVRNPWDRLVSEYNAACHKQRRAKHRRIHAMNDFADYIRFEIGRDKLQQHRLVLNRHGDIGVDFLGRFETLKPDFDSVCRRLRIDYELPVTNRFPHRHYSRYYTPETRNLVARHWARDIEMFGYRFQEA